MTKLTSQHKQVLTDIQCNRAISDHSALSSLRKRGLAVMNGDGTFRLTIMGREVYDEVEKAKQKAGVK